MFQHNEWSNKSHWLHWAVSEIVIVHIQQCGLVAQWLGVGLVTGGRVQSQPLHCRVRPWTSCSHTLFSASGVTTLWCYIYQFKF